MSENEKKILEGKINPRVVRFSIGTKKLREINIYPLSLADEFNLDEMIQVVMREFVTNYAEITKVDIAFVQVCLNLIKQNLEKFFSLVTDEVDGNILSEIDNDQALDFVNHVFEMNFGGPAKKAMALWEKIRSSF